MLASLRPYDRSGTQNGPLRRVRQAQSLEMLGSFGQIERAANDLGNRHRFAAETLTRAPQSAARPLAGPLTSRHPHL